MKAEKLDPKLQNSSLRYFPSYFEKKNEKENIFHKVISQFIKSYIE